MSECTHDLAERETDVADGMCPKCLVKEIDRLKAEAEAQKYLIQEHIDQRNEAELDRDAWKAKAEKMAVELEELKKCKDSGKK